jgi:phosphoadenosine phosphosulfate reductase
LKQPSFVGTTIYESDLRKQVWRLNGCNVVSKHQQKSTPLSILKTEEIWRYIKENNIKVSKAYEMGWKRTGCLMCQMGIQFKAKRQELLLVKKYYPTIWEIYKPYFEPYWIKMGYKELYE